MKILVTLHLYHVDLWDEFKEKLLKLNREFDLYVSITKENKDFKTEIIKVFPKVKVFVLPNKGLDVGPFLKILKHLKQKKLTYDFIIKLHTKKTEEDIGRGTIWRKQLVDALILDNRTLDNNIEVLCREGNGLCGAYVWMTLENCNTHNDVFPLSKYKNKFLDFIGGTMFMVRGDLMLDSFTIKDLDSLYKKMPVGYVASGSVAHSMERILCFVVQDKGYKVIGV